jgi:hypothetical protein
MSEECKSCPFCGWAENLQPTYLGGDSDIATDVWRVRCPNCGSSTGFRDRDGAIKSWNARAKTVDQAAFDACVEALEAIKRHQSLCLDGQPELSTTWRIAYKALELVNRAKGDTK